MTTKILKKVFRRYKIELILLLISLIFSFFALFAYFRENQKLMEKETIIFEKESYKEKPSYIFVDVSGAVKKPNLYKLPTGSRFKKAIDLAGGLANEADKIFYQRYFNLAQILHDQEKIYIPSLEEVNAGLVESYLILPYWQNKNTQETTSVQNSNLININQADINELDQLPGVGKVTAEKIINNRPYTSIDDLLNKKIVNSSVFEQIKALITI